MREGGRESALTLSAMLVSAPRLHSSSSTVEHPYIVHIITAVRPFCRTYRRRSSRGKKKGEEKKARIRVRMRKWVRKREEQRVLSKLDSSSLSNDGDKREERREDMM